MSFRTRSQDFSIDELNYVVDVKTHSTSICLIIAVSFDNDSLCFSTFQISQTTHCHTYYETTHFVTATEVVLS